MTPYETIAESIIQKQILVLGQMIALERAGRVKGLEIDGNGKVKRLLGNTIEILENLIGQYQELLGPAAISFSKDAALPIIKQNPGLALPRALQ